MTDVHQQVKTERVPSALRSASLWDLRVSRRLSQRAAYRMPTERSRCRGLATLTAMRWCRQRARWVCMRILRPSLC